MTRTMVQIHKGSNSAGGIYIYEEFIEGTIVRVNKKSIRIHMTHAKCIVNGKITREYDMNEETTFKFWKTIETAGKTVSIFKNNKYGIVRVVY